MTKQEIKKVSSHELITEYVKSYSLLMSNYLLNRGIEKVSKHCQDLESELVKRGILTDSDVKYLNA